MYEKKCILKTKYITYLNFLFFYIIKIERCKFVIIFCSNVRSVILICVDKYTHLIKIKLINISNSLRKFTTYSPHKNNVNESF